MKVETGDFKCFIHDRVFEDLTTFNKQLKMVDHTHIGIAPCEKCEKQTKFKYIGKVDDGIYKPTCEDCENDD